MILVFKIEYRLTKILNFNCIYWLRNVEKVCIRDLTSLIRVTTILSNCH